MKMLHEDPYTGLISMLKGGSGAENSYMNITSCSILTGTVISADPLGVYAAGLELDGDEITLLGGAGAGIDVHVEGGTAVFSGAAETSPGLAVGDELVLLTADMQSFYAFRR